MRTRYGIVLVLLAACGNATPHPPPIGASTEQSGADAAAPSSDTFGPDRSDCSDPNAGDLHGCTCSQPTRVCLSVPPAFRNHGTCKDGVQTCAKAGEFSFWGACVGEVAGCSFEEKTPDGPGCCVPGTQRWCDTAAACAWGRQDCKPDGTWGACSETPARPAGCSTERRSYDEDCCVAAGQCCQDLYPSSNGGSSIGACDGIACPSDVAIP
jgi:hypothetical protein